jgi:hypothetical protein
VPGATKPEHVGKRNGANVAKIVSNLPFHNENKDLGQRQSAHNPFSSLFAQEFGDDPKKGQAIIGTRMSP